MCFDNSSYILKCHYPKLQKVMDYKNLKDNELEYSGLQRSRFNRVFMDFKISIPYLFSRVR